MLRCYPVRHCLLLGVSLLLGSACQRAPYYSFQRVAPYAIVRPLLLPGDTLVQPATTAEAAPTLVTSRRPLHWHLTEAVRAQPARRLVLGLRLLPTRFPPALGPVGRRAWQPHVAPADRTPPRERSQTISIVLLAAAGACYLLGFPALFFGVIKPIHYVGLGFLLAWLIWKVSRGELFRR